MTQGSIYVSQIGLNIEDGKIEIPYNPVIRFATPIFVDEKQAGIVFLKVIAHSAPPFLSRKVMEDKTEEDYIVADQNGFYLCS